MTGVPLHIIGGLEGVVAQGMEEDMTGVLRDISRGLDRVVG